MSPSAAFLAAAFAFGADSPLGFVLLLAGESYLVVNLALIQPWLSRQPGTRYAAVPDLMSWCGQQLVLCSTVSELSGLLMTANRLISGSEHAVLIIGSTTSLELYGGNLDGSEVTHAGDAILWLRAQRQVVYRNELESNTAPARLMDRLDCQVVLPLCDSGTALGLALVHADLENMDQATEQAYRWLCAASSIALARIGLEFDMRRALELVGIVDYARATQQALMPDDRPIEGEGFRLRGFSRPAAQCGGDLWAWRNLGKGQILVVIGDVTGHGVVPAVVSATAAGAIHASAFAKGPELDPAQLLSEVNRSLYRVVKGAYMMTAFAAIADLNTGELRYANAGQNFPYLITPTGENRAAKDDDQGKPHLKVLVARGPMLGSGPEARFECHRYPLAIGQKLFLYTDGITEAQTARNHSFGERRLRKALRELAGRSANSIAIGVFEEVKQFLMGRPWTDDITIVVLERPTPQLAGQDVFESMAGGVR